MGFSPTDKNRAIRRVAVQSGFIAINLRVIWEMSVSSPRRRIETNRFGKSPHHAPSRSEALSPATNNTKHIVRAALAALKHIYREGLAYKRAGVMLLDLVEAGRELLSKVVYGLIMRRRDPGVLHLRI